MVESGGAEPRSANIHDIGVAVAIAGDGNSVGDINPLYHLPPISLINLILCPCSVRIFFPSLLGCPLPSLSAPGQLSLLLDFAIACERSDCGCL